MSRRTPLAHPAARVIAATAAATLVLLVGVHPAESTPAPTGAQMVLVFEATAAGQWPYVLLGEASAPQDAADTVRVKVNWGETGDPATSTVTQITTRGVYKGNGIGAGILFPAPGTYTVTISPLTTGDDAVNGSDTGPWLTLYGGFRGEVAGRDTAFFAGAARLVGVTSFGDLGITALSNAFADQTSFVDVPTTLPAGVTDLVGTFDGATAFDDGDVGSWDVSAVTRMNSTFQGATSFNRRIDAWDVSSVTDMSRMFDRATVFDQPLANWERADSTLGNVTEMDNMFEDADAFNQPIGNWDVSSVTNMDDMFEDALAFNQPIGTWNVSSVTTMDNMFEGAVSFNQPLAGWERVGSTLANVADFADMFKGASVFDQPIGNWNVSGALDMNDMFEDALAFDQPIGGWNVGAVTRMSQMFNGATSFDQPIGGWDVSSVTDMNEMMQNTASFDRSLGDWDLNPSSYLGDFFTGSGISSSCYDATLVGWAALDPAVTGLDLDATGVEYSPVGAAARTTLVGRSWSITGDTGVAEATGRCAQDGGAEVTAAAAGPTVACTPSDPEVGATVTCEVRGGDPGIDVLWRAEAGGGPLAEGAVRIGPDGLGTFTFVATESTLRQVLTVELVAWTQPVTIGTVGGPLPTVVRAGEGFGGVDRLPATLVPVAILALLLGAPLVGGRRAGRASRG